MSTGERGSAPPCSHAAPPRSLTKLVSIPAAFRRPERRWASISPAARKTWTQRPSSPPASCTEAVGDRLWLASASPEDAPRDHNSLDLIGSLVDLGDLGVAHE